MANNVVKNRNDWLLSTDASKLASKSELANDYVMYMVNRCIQMFEYNDLPDTITAKDIEFLVQNIGYACFTKVGDKYYVFNCSLGGEPNEYYLPTLAIVVNPYLKISEQLVIDKDCVIIKNDSTYKGLLNMHKKYANLLAEVDISLKYACWNSRLLNLVVAETDSAKKDAENILNKIVAGEEVGIIGGRQGLENIQTYPYSAGSDNTIKSLLELRQYLYATWYIDLGINANYNMKRESLSANEVAVNEDTLLPLIDDMLQVREQALEKINKMYGLNISVKLNSSWDKIQIAVENEEEQNDINTELLKAQVEQTLAQAEEPQEEQKEGEDETERNDKQDDSSSDTKEE